MRAFQQQPGVGFQMVRILMRQNAPSRGRKRAGQLLVSFFEVIKFPTCWPMLAVGVALLRQAGGRTLVPAFLRCHPARIPFAGRSLRSLQLGQLTTGTDRAQWSRRHPPATADSTSFTDKRDDGNSGDRKQKMFATDFNPSTRDTHEIEDQETSKLYQRLRILARTKGTN